MAPSPLLSRPRLIDLAGAAPQLLLYGAAIAATILRVQPLLAAPGPSPTALLDAASQGANALYLAVLIVLLLIRPPPVAELPGLLPRLCALVGFSFAGILILLPRAQVSAGLAALSLALTLASALASLAVIAYLGRAFSLFPQARRLVVGGPYRLVRHPLYLAESIGAVGVSLQFQQPWGLIFAAAAIAAQLPRTHYEEKVLARAFPEYAAYAARTRRLVPGVY